MNPIRYLLTLLLVVTLLSAVCCSPSDHIDQAIREADRMAYISPDSSLSILEALPDSELAPKQKALKALLYTKCRFILGEESLSDSKIREAVNYFRNQGDSLEVQSLYYLGKIHLIHSRPDTALVVMTEAHSRAESIKDHYFTALSAETLAKIYGDLLIIEKKLEYALKARESFILSGRPEMTVNTDLNLIDALIWLGRFEDAREECRRFVAEHGTDDISAMNKLILEQSVMYHQMDSISQSLRLMEELRENGMKFESNKWSRLGYYYVAEGKFKQAMIARDSAMVDMKTREDSLFYGLLEALIAGESGDYKSGYEKALKWGYDIMNDGDERITHPKTLLLNDYFNMLANNERLQKEQTRTRNINLMIGCVLLIVILMLITVYFRSRLKLNKAAAETMMMRVSALENDISRHHTASDSLHEEIRLLFQDKLTMLNNMCEVWYRAGESDDRTGQFRKGIVGVLTQMQSEETLRNFAEIIDRHEDGWYSGFKTVFPDLKERQYQLAVYMYLRFSNEAIAAMMNKKTLNAVYIDKSKLKSVLAKSDNPEAERYIADLGFGS